MFDHSKIKISDKTHYLKIFRETGIGMITVRLDFDDPALRRKLRHSLGISIPSVRHIEATLHMINLGVYVPPAECGFME